MRDRKREKGKGRKGRSRTNNMKVVVFDEVLDLVVHK